MQVEDSFLVLPRPQQHQLLQQQQQALQQADLHDHGQQQAYLREVSREADEARCEIPLCGDCMGVIIHDLENQIKDAYNQNEVLRQALAELQHDPRDADADAESLRAEIAKVQAEEQQLERELEGVLRAQDEVDKERAGLAAQLAEADAATDEHWRAVNAAQLEDERAADEHLAKAEVLAHCRRELERLKATSVLDDVFDIWFAGPFGTINGLRLGRLPDTPVDWSEINAGLGHAALLVDTLASLHQLRFPRHVLHPMGSFSKIALADDPRNLYDLHGSGTLQFGRIFSGTRFDTALAMFLQCIGALVSHARASASATLGPPPYRIEDDRIGLGDNLLSIRMQFNQDELWTRALKYMLTNLKWLLAWHTQLSASKQGGMAV